MDGAGGEAQTLLLFKQVQSITLNHKHIRIQQADVHQHTSHHTHTNPANLGLMPGSQCGKSVCLLYMRGLAEVALSCLFDPELSPGYYSMRPG